MNTFFRMAMIAVFFALNWPVAQPGAEAFDGHSTPIPVRKIGHGFAVIARSVVKPFRRKPKPVKPWQRTA